MELQERIERQRVQYIIDSFSLQGNGCNLFQECLEELFSSYEISTIELAIVDTLLTYWMHLPPLKGMSFIAALQNRLRNKTPFNFTASHYRSITGLDLAPVLKQPSPSNFPV